MTPREAEKPSAADHDRPRVRRHPRLVDLMPSIGAHLRVPGCPEDVLGLPAADRYVVVLIDGLGWNLLRRAVREAPYLGSLLGDAQPITSGVPSTTVTSLASLGTGLPPGQHGMVGYTSRVPSTGEILNALTWESDLVARAYQTKPTFFERAVDSRGRGQLGGPGALPGHRPHRGGPARRGLRRPSRASAAEDLRIELTVEAAARGDRSIVYAYERELDHCGHVLGCRVRDLARPVAPDRRDVRAAAGRTARRRAPDRHRRPRHGRHRRRASDRG